MQPFEDKGPREFLNENLGVLKMLLEITVERDICLVDISEPAVTSVCLSFPSFRGA